MLTVTPRVAPNLSHIVVFPEGGGGGGGGGRRRGYSAFHACSFFIFKMFLVFLFS